MTSTEGWDESDSSGAGRRTDGSGNGYIADTHLDLNDAGETTSLLGAGVHSSNGTTDETHAPAEEGGWAGREDFAGLPWWKTPSVC
jgi:hypothetical protein